MRRDVVAGAQIDLRLSVDEGRLGAERTRVLGLAELAPEARVDLLGSLPRPDLAELRSSERSLLGFLTNQMG